MVILCSWQIVFIQRWHMHHIIGSLIHSQVLANVFVELSWNILLWQTYIKNRLEDTVFEISSSIVFAFLYYLSLNRVLFTSTLLSFLFIILIYSGYSLENFDWELLICISLLFGKLYFPPLLTIPLLFNSANK